MIKSKYKVDKNNQLTITIGREQLRPDGVFAVDRDNQLIYKVREPLAWRQENNIPECITLQGKWGIDRRHQLTYTLRKTETQAGEKRLLYFLLFKATGR